MGHHHHYFTTPFPSNFTNNNQKNNFYSIYLIIFFIIGLILVYNYIKYLQSKYNNRLPNQIIYQEEDENEDFPDINDFLPNYLNRVRNINPAPLVQPPPAYENTNTNENNRILEEPEPPSYDSIVTNMHNNTVNTETTNS